jgi:hypothetical protein
MDSESTTARREWRRCRPWIEAAVRRAPFGLETIEDVERMIEEGHYQFWPGRRCAAITEIQVYARKKALCVVHGGGELAELIEEMEPALCDFARAAGCDLVTGIGRKGWQRVCEKHGYSFGWVAMIKALKH